MIPARRADNPSHLRSLALEPIKVNNAAAELKRTDWSVVLVLHHDLHSGVRL